MNYQINRNWWLKWYWPHIEQIYRTEGHYGTRQTGKTHNIARKLIYHSFQPKKFNVVHTRKQYNQIEGSTFKILKDITFKHFHHDFTVTKDHFQLVNKNTGNWFRGLGMDNPENAKSIEGANVAWMNEASQFTIDDYDYLDTTIRGATDCEISMIMDWNPEYCDHWIQKEAMNNKQSNTIFQKSTFWNNYLIDRNALHQKLLTIKSRGAQGERKYKVWALGECGMEDPEKLFIRNFTEKHIGKPEYEIHKDVYLAFDLNYDPTCTIIQKTNTGFKALNEYGEKGTALPIVLSQIKRDYPGAFFIVNGDASGHYSRNLTDNNTSYEIIKNILNLSWTQFNVPKANPSHKRSRLQCNALFDFTDTIIHESCVRLIKDIESCIVDEAGSIDPWKKANPELSHNLDNVRYHVNAEHQDIFRTIGFENIEL